MKDSYLNKVNTKALQALDKAILYGGLCGSKRPPGHIIENMKVEDRELLKQLTSEDAKNQIPTLLR